MEQVEHGQSPEPILTPVAFAGAGESVGSQNAVEGAMRPSQNDGEEFPTELLSMAAKGVSKGLAKLAGESDANARDAWGRDALMLAAEAGHIHCVRALLKHCDPKAVDAKGETALMMASRHSRRDCALELLNVSDVLRKNNAGMTAWGVALVSGMVDGNYAKPRVAKAVEPAKKKQKAVASPKVERVGKSKPIGEACAADAGVVSKEASVDPVDMGVSDNGSQGGSGDGI